MKKTVKKYQSGGPIKKKGLYEKDGKQVVKVTFNTPKSEADRKEKYDKMVDKWIESEKARKRAKEDDEVGGQDTSIKKRGGSVKQKKKK
jgi:hypothetical protein